jgi:hypothetical protein
MPAFNSERVLLGLTLIAAGFSQLAYSQIFSELIWLVFGSACASLGIAVTVLGFLRNSAPFKKLLGIKLLGLSYGFAGFLVILAGALQFTPLLVLAMVCFVVSWGLIKAKTWARLAALLITVLGLPISVATSTMNVSIPIVESFPLVPFILISAYSIWYLNRSHVTEFFEPEKATKTVHYAETERHLRWLVTLTLGLILLASFLTYCYFNPMNDYPIIQKVIGWGQQGSGELGSPPCGTSIPFSATQGDLLNYNFQCTEEAPAHTAHFWLTIEISETERETIVEKIGFEGSGSVWVPQTGECAMWIAGPAPQTKVIVQCDVLVMSYSLRKPIAQALFLNLFGLAATIFLMRPRINHSQLLPA